MKKLAALILVFLFCLTSAQAAEWAEGRSPAQPYAGVPEVNLEETMGYIMLYPRVKMPAERFCDVLEIYLPREDLALGDGSLTLCDADGEVAKISFADSDLVELRPLEEVELEALLWGSGMCIDVHLPVSLKFDHTYYVRMDANCFSAVDGKLKSLPITYNKKEPDKQAWSPVLGGDYGVSGLYYSAPAEQPEGEEPAAEAPAEPKLNHEVGDVIHFDLVLGGDAKVAVAYSENGSVEFEIPEYSESGPVTGTIVGEELSWGVVFLDENGDVLDFVQLS